MSTNRFRTFFDMSILLFALVALFMIYVRGLFFLFREWPTPVTLLGAAGLLAATVVGGRRLFW